MEQKFKIEFISAEQTRDLRHRVLRPHQKFEQCHYPGDDTSTTFHMGVYQGEKIVGVGSFYKEPSPHFQYVNQYRLRGMATEETVRRQGVGAKLLIKSYAILETRSCPLLWCYARQVAFPFYESMGMGYFGDTFDIADIGPHKVMFKKF